MGFKAVEQVEELTYDFTPHVSGSKATGTIPEPASKAIEDYRGAIIASFKEAGITSESDVAEFTLDQMDELMVKSDSIEAAMVIATGNLTGIAQDTLRALPYRIKRAFLGWIMGQFFNPEV